MLRFLVERVGLGCLLGLLVLGVSGRLSDAVAMPPYIDEASGKPPSPKMAAAIDLYNQMRHSFAERGINQPGGGLAAGAKVTGTFNVLALCVDFPDKSGTVSATELDTLVFNNAHGSVRDFYSENSYGALIITTINLPSTIGWQQVSQNYSYYVNGSYGLGAYPNNSQKMVEELVDLVDPLVSFANYDNDGDGFVDGLIIMHAGRGAEYSASTSDMWSHKWGIMPRIKDGKYVSSYSVQPEYWSTPGDITIGVYAHETGHLFGLPDLYDTDGSSRGLGRWSLMSGGAWNGSVGNSPAHLDAWCKAQVGFLTPTVVDSNITGASIPDVETHAHAYRLWSDGTLGSEYFLLENRQRTGYDAGLPSSGLLIWHIDDTQYSNANEWYPGHTASGHYWVALQQADGLWQMEKNTSYGDGGDPFPGSGAKTTFSAATTPNSNSYSGAATYVTVTNISASGPTMTCDFQVSLSAGILDDNDQGHIRYTMGLSNSPNPFNPSTIMTFTSEAGGPVTLMVYDILGRHVNTLFSGDAASGVHQLTWNGDDESGRPVASGVYFGRLAGAKGSVVRKMVLMR